MRSTEQNLNTLDQLIVKLFWDAEFIKRDGDSKTYTVFPSEPNDKMIAASVGATLASKLANPILIWANSPEET